MIQSTHPSPPAWADRVLEWYCAPHLLEDLQGDLHELFYIRLHEKGKFLARIYFILDVFSFFRPHIFKRRRSDKQSYRYSMLFRHYIKTAFRNVKRDKQYLTINTMGLALGIGCSLLLIAYIFSELSFDRHVKNAERVYRVSCSTLIDTKQTDFAPIPPAIGLALKASIQEIEKMTRLMLWSYNTGSSAVSYDDKSFYQENIFVADSTVFDVLDYRFLLGNAEALQEPDRIVLSNSLAKKIFGAEYLKQKDLINTVIKVDQREFAISGIMEDTPYASHFRPQAFIGWQGYGNDEVWNDSHAYTYIRLAPGNDPGKVQEKINVFISENENIKRVAEEFGAKVAVFIQPLTDIHLQSDKMYELSAGGNIGYIYAFAVIAIFFLLSSGINYTNLAIAASAHRYKEIGVRKVMGALRDQIQKQFVTESALMTFFAAAVGLLFFYLLIPHFNQLMEYQLNIALLLDPTFLGIALCVVIILSILSGFYPAFYLSLVNPVSIFKNQSKAGLQKMHFRKILLIAQFTISAIMIIAVLVVTAQMNYLGQKELGFNKENMIIVSIPGPQMRALPVLKEELLKVSGVSGAAVCDYIPGLSNMIDEHYVERSDGEMKSSTVSRLHFDKDYLSLLGLTIIQGRNFDPANPADYKNAFLVNEAAVRAYGWNETREGPLGRKINGFNYGKEGEVIGVVKDVNLFSLKQKIEPLVMNLSAYAGFLYLKIDGKNTSKIIGDIEKTYKKVFEDHPLEYQFLDERFERLYESDRKMNAALLSGAQVLIFISCLGLFGLSAFMVMQRTKEIGVRKVLGASLREIMVLLSGDYIKLIVMANAIAIPLGYVFINKWLEGYAYRVDFSWWLMIVPVIATVLLALISISFQVVKASRTNPVNVLKCE